MKDKILILDGNSIINRSYYAMRNLTNKDGFYTGGLFGFTRQILMLIEQHKPKYACVAFDLKAPTFRHNMYKEYKGNRKGMPDELRMQMPVMKEIIDALGIARVELEGYEADDILGTVAEKSQELGVEAIVITGDKDALQLVKDGVRVFIAKKGGNEEYTEESVFEDLGVYPYQVTDYKGLSGDNSDNIPGVPRIGPKTASKLLLQFETIENLYENIEDVKNANQKKLLIDNKEQALMSKELAKILIDMPVEFDIDEFLIKEGNSKLLFEFFTTYNFKSIMGYLKNEESNVEPEISQYQDFSVKYISDPKEVLNFIENNLSASKLENKGVVSFKFAYDKANYRDEQVLGLGLSYKNDTDEIENIYLNLNNVSDLENLKEFFEDDKIKKIGHSTKQDYLLLMRYGIKLKSVIFDSYIAMYLVDPARKNYEISDVAFEEVKLKIQSEEEFLGKGAKKKNLGDFIFDMEAVATYIGSQTYSVFHVYNKLMEAIKTEGLLDLFENIEMPLIEVLASIEFEGFNIDKKELDDIDIDLTELIKNIEKEIYADAGHEFNINSPKQLGVILFEEMGIEPIKKTKTGYSTSHDILVKLSKLHPIAENIIQYRTYAKLKSTYIDGIRNVINPISQKVHTSLNQTVTVTGRLSSTDPNLQNIPVRLPLGRRIRKLFIPMENNILVGADYSQIELRVLAHMSQDPTLLDAFENDKDIHTITAAQVFGIDPSEVDSTQRSRAKEVNFGIVYGMGEFGLSESLKISRYEAKEYIENYFLNYPNVRVFMDDIIDNCKKDLKVTTLLGRVRHVSDINHSNFNVRSAAERIARNTPIQGSAADIMKIAMIKVYDELKAKQLKSKIILQVHDELLIDTFEDERDQVTEILIRNMEDAFSLDVPLKVDCNLGASWFDAK